MSTAAPITPPPAMPRKDPAPRLWTPDEFQRMCDLGILDPATVTLAGGVVLHAADFQPVVYTRKEYYALDDAGFFRNQRVQLIGGTILEETTVMNPPHAAIIRLATMALERVFTDGFDVRAQLPLNLGLTSEPEPDIAVVTGTVRDYTVDHPRTAVLVVEVSESTLEDDTHTKMSLYAAGGIADYWVINVNGRVLVFRDPKPESGQPFGSAYARVTIYTHDEVIMPLAAPGQSVNVNDLLP